ncbi:MAG: polysaccharide biosynthesis/export family protein [Flavobacteriales bacterium]|jgi:polysaccharide export outer membrane protein|nr:polysaccharide biosynthesis/export family protein [Flavobacteriales bacterium]
MQSPFRTWAIALLVLLVGLSGCTINRDIMFKTAREHRFDAFTDTAFRQIIVQPNDVLEFRLFANDGFKLIDLVSEGAGRDVMWMNRMVIAYNVEHDGLVKLPLLGRVPVGGLTVREAEIDLEKRYERYYNKPFVQLNIVNRRVVVFPGGGGDAQVVALENNATTLLEVLGLAGGLNVRGDARQVKLFRLRPDGTRAVHVFDLSTIEGLKHGDIVMQGDDVVYVQPNPDLARGALRDLAPIVTLLTSLVLVYGVVRSFQ